MKASLKIEAIGDDTDQVLRSYRNLTNSLSPGLGDFTFGDTKKGYWVAEITGLDPKYKYQRKFLSGKKDYQHANSKGSRGVYVYYLLGSGRIYEVLQPVSWKNSNRYFCTVSADGEILIVDKDFIDQWIKDHSESAPTKPQGNE